MTVSLTKFIDFVNTSGMPKMKVVEDYLSSGKYEPGKDFYKRFRDAAVDLHKEDLEVEYLEKVFNSLTDKKKRPHYAELNKGYRTFLKSRKISWFDPPSVICDATGLEISINPELGLIIGTTPHIVKMYMKQDKLTRSNVNMTITLMEIALSDCIDEDTVITILDVRNGRLYRASAKRDTEKIMMQLELESDYWKKVASKR
ncbi:MAG: hypothetical protein JXR78_10890 [Victivallales bacterium]|nr:hypothetical protein [Victivallales bacterium]